MDLVRLTLRNFKSFKGEHTFDFSKHGPGLHFLGGDNRAEPQLGANGAGKSSLLDALFWVLYGRSMRGVRSPDIHSWDTKETTEVELDFKHNDTSYNLFRSWSPNKLILKTPDNDGVGEDLTQDTLLAIVKLSAESFQNSVIIGQFTSMFLDLKPAEKLSIFSDLLNLKYWEDRSAEALEMRNDCEVSGNKIKMTISNLSGVIKTLKESKIQYSMNSKNFEKNRKFEVGKLIKSIKQEKSSTKENEILVKKFTEDLTNVSLKYNKVSAKFLNLEASLNKNKQELQIEKINQAKVLERGRFKKESISHYENITGEVCVECDQLVPESHTNKPLKKLKKELNRLNKKNIEFKKFIKEYDGLIEGIQSKINKTKTSLKKIENLRSKANVGISLSKRDYDRSIQLFDEYTKGLENKRNETNPFKESLEEVTNEIDESKELLLRKKKALKLSEKHQKAFEYWRGAFRNIRLYVVEKALISFEIEINNSLIQLGLEDWTIKLDIERELKSGGVARGFTVLIQSPYNVDPVPWESWSGGEGQRLRLAGTLALANFIRSMTGFESELEIYDEPTSHLGGGGIQDLLQLLYQRAHNENRCIWLIDHHSIDFSFDTITTVIKDDNGSRILV